MFCRTHIRIQVENKQNQAKGAKQKAKSVMQKCAKKIHGEAYLHIKSGPTTDVGGARPTQEPTTQR